MILDTENIRFFQDSTTLPIPPGQPSLLPNVITAQPTSNELLPCPFCGHAARLFHDRSSDYERQWSWGVECQNEGECEAGLTGFASKEAAIAKWNSRRRYIHRNGETTPPTMPGKYWFRGVTSLWTGRINLQLALDCIERDGRILAWEERSQEHLLVVHFDGQWWGPIAPPWEKGA